MTLDGGCCPEAFEHALRLATPDIFHRDHGSQFTRADCTSRLETAGVNISLDGRGRALDHVCVECLWRTVHDEEVSLQECEDAQGGDTGVRAVLAVIQYASVLIRR